MLQETNVDKHSKTTFVNFYRLWTKIINVFGLAPPGNSQIMYSALSFKTFMYQFDSSNLQVALEGVQI